MKKDIAEFVAKCPNFKQVKAENQKSSGLTQEIQVPTWKWKDINMDFVVDLPRTQRQYDSIWVGMGSLTMSSHFIPVKFAYSVENYTSIFIDESVCFHGVPLSIISYRGAQYRSRFLEVIPINVRY